MPRFSLSLLVLLLAATGISIPFPSAAAEFRFWQGVASEQQLEARFVKFEGGHAFLQTRDDRIVRVSPAELSPHDLKYLKILSQGGDPADLPARVQPEQRAANAGYRIERVPTQKVEATMTMKVTAPSLVAKEWVLFSARPPRLDAQEVTSGLSPGGRSIRELSSQSRDLMRARLPAVRSDLEKSVEVSMEVKGLLFSRKLVETNESTGRVAALPEATRRHYLAESRLMDYRSSGFQRWMNQQQFQRTGNESQIDFARRVYLGVSGGFSYTYAEEMDRAASNVCQTGKSDCGGLAILFASVLRANGIPARLLVGRWAKSSEAGERLNGVEYFQQHVKAEFYADGVGWIPVDVSREIGDGNDDGLQCFGNDQGDFIVLHFDHDLEVDTIHFGRETLTWLQGLNYWVTGEGKLDGSQVEFDWKVESTPPDKALTSRP